MGAPRTAVARKIGTTMRNDRFPFVSDFNGKRRKKGTGNGFMSCRRLDFEACVEVTAMIAMQFTSGNPRNLHRPLNAIDQHPELNFDVTRRRFALFPGSGDHAA